MEALLSIITINYNGLDDTCSLIDTIPFDDYPLEVIVVDNASRDDEATIIEHRYPQVRVIRSIKNLGFAGGNNLGIRAAKGQFLFFVNNDTVFFRESKVKVNLQALVNRFASSSKIGAICPKIRFFWDDAPIQFAGYTPLSSITMRNSAIGYDEQDHGQYNTAHPTPYAHGAAMMVKREVIDQVGMMPECYFLYYEELDWSIMIRRAGYEIWYDPTVTVFHKESRATGQSSPLRMYYITRNRLLFVKRNYSGFKGLCSKSYLIGIVAPKDMLLSLLHGKLRHALSVINGIVDYIKL